MADMPSYADPRWEFVENRPDANRQMLHAEGDWMYFTQVWNLTDEDNVTHELVVSGVNRRALTARPPV